MKKIFLSVFMIICCFFMLDDVFAGTTCVYKKEGDDVYWAIHKDPYTGDYSLQRLNFEYADGLGSFSKSESKKKKIDSAIYDCPDKIYYSSSNGWTTDSSNYINEYTKMTGIACYYSYERDHLFSNAYFYVFNDSSMNSKLFYAVDPSEFDIQPIDFYYSDFLNGSGYFCPNLRAVEGAGDWTLNYYITSSSTDENLMDLQINTKFNNSSFVNTSIDDIAICNYEDATVEINKKTLSIVKIEKVGCDTVSSAHTISEVYNKNMGACYEDIEVFTTETDDLDFDNVDCKLTFKIGRACYNQHVFELKNTEAINMTNVTDMSDKGMPHVDANCRVSYKITDSEGNVTLGSEDIDNKYECSTKYMGFDCKFNEDKTKKICNLVNCSYEYKQIDYYIPVCGVLKPVENGGKLLPIIKNLYKMLKIAIPILVFALTVAEFLKVLFSGEEKTMKDAFQATYKRLILMAVLILLPFIVEFIIRLAGISENCLQHLL